MLDTPGTLWPKLDDQNAAMHLAFIGSIKDDVLDINEVAINLIDFLKTNKSGALTERYKISSENAENIQIFEEIAVKRGFVLRGVVFNARDHLFGKFVGGDEFFGCNAGFAVDTYAEFHVFVRKFKNRRAFCRGACSISSAAASLFALAVT